LPPVGVSARQDRPRPLASACSIFGEGADVIFGPGARYRFGDEHQEAVVGRVEMAGEFDDLMAEGGEGLAIGDCFFQGHRRDLLGTAALCRWPTATVFRTFDTGWAWMSLESLREVSGGTGVLEHEVKLTWARRCLVVLALGAPPIIMA
jgi:hypothetical protein